MDKQEIFDTVARGILSQGGPSYGLKPGKETRDCLYRDQFGRKCAAGWLIPDSLYHEKMEGMGFTKLYFFIDLIL